MRAFHEIRTYEDEFMVWHSSYSNIAYMAHWHEEIELAYVRSGTFEVTVNNQAVTAHKGDLIFCDSGEIHYSHPDQVDNSVDFLIFDCHILGPRYHSSFFVSPLISRRQLEEAGLTACCRDLFNTVITELETRMEGYQEIIRCTLTRFWLLLMRSIPRQDPKTALEGRRLLALDSFQKLLDYMETHYNESFTLETGARFTHFSPSYFSRTFKSLMGISYVSCLNLIRIRQACDRLSRGSSSLSTALSCGFTNIRTFNRVFKQYTGMTPSQFAALPDCSHFSIRYPKTVDGYSRMVRNDSSMMIHYEKNKCRPLKETDVPSEPA